MRGRPVRTEYVWDPQGRLLRTYTASPWTGEDRALMLAWARYQESLCEGCGEPREIAWHPDMEGWYEVHHLFTCWSCTAKAEAVAKDGQRVDPVTYPGHPVNTWPKDKRLDPIDLDSPDIKI